MAKRDFVDHCDFVDPVGEFRRTLVRWIRTLSCSGLDTVSVSVRWRSGDRPSAAQRKERLVHLTFDLSSSMMQTFLVLEIFVINVNCFNTATARLQCT